MFSYRNERTTDQGVRDLFDKRKFEIGVYKGTVVFIKRICKKSIDLTRNVRKELIQVRFEKPFKWVPSMRQYNPPTLIL